MNLHRRYLLGLCSLSVVSIAAASAASYTPPPYTYPDQPVFTPVEQPVSTTVPQNPVVSDPVRILPVQQFANPAFINPINVPTDVVYPIPSASANVVPPVGMPEAISGISQAKDFPSLDSLKGPTDYILIQSEGANDGNWHRESPYMVNLLKGEVFASVKKPSNVGMINTPLGQVALSASTDAFISYEDGILRIRNIDGLGQKLRINLDKGYFSGVNARVFSVAPGFELVVSDHKLSRTDLRPHDGIMRRSPQLFAEGYCGVSQYNLESALNSSTIVGDLARAESDIKSHRVIADMSKMAAVLNVVNGQYGFVKD